MVVSVARFAYRSAGAWTYSEGAARSSAGGGSEERHCGCYCVEVAKRDCVLYVEILSVCG